MKDDNGNEILDPELLRLGMEKLDDALFYFDEMTSFQGRNMSSTVYVALRYGENITEFTG